MIENMGDNSESQNHASVPRPTRQIFVTGGVASSLGKGLTASSLGRLLTERGLRVVMQKLDPYINVDPGTMNPFQHGEVFVTEDGAETDLDIGHYERFLDKNLTGDANSTTGQVYSTVLARERAGEYLGECVQVIPHITGEIMDRMRAQTAPDADGSVPDVVITEIGGTVGDIESQPFLEAARQIAQKLGRENVFFIHVSLIPYLAAGGELKTKPTQHSVAQLRAIGIMPDAVVLRCDRDLPDEVKNKVALMCGIERRGVIQCEDRSSIYEIPKVLHNQGLDELAINRLRLVAHKVDWSAWDSLLERVHHPKEEIRVALVGKYIDLHDAYLSVAEALRAGGFYHQVKVEIDWVGSDECANPEQTESRLRNVDAILVPGGFGIRGIEGKLEALRYAREHKVPTLGICLGMQAMVIEAARNILGLDASSTEFDRDTPNPVISTMEEQHAILYGDGDMGGSMRLGSYRAFLSPGSVVEEAYGESEVQERHRHRYEFNAAYRDVLDEAGLHVSGVSPDGALAEYVELDRDLHPFYVGCQAHPEFKSRPTRPHPLFAALIGAAIRRRGV